MTWSEIVVLFKRLDSQLSDAAYFHGRCLIGQEKPRNHVREHAVDSNLRKPPSAGRVDGEKDEGEIKSQGVAQSSQPHLCRSRRPDHSRRTNRARDWDPSTA